MDHIIPRNQGGPDDLSNFQALCFRCNAGKRDTDRTDFRGLLVSYQHRQEDSSRVLLENELALCIADAYPVSEGHSLVIPRRHVSDGLELHQPEWNAVVELLKRRREQLAADDAGISGWAGLLNARGGLNSGEAAGPPCMALCEDWWCGALPMPSHSVRSVSKSLCLPYSAARIVGVGSGRSDSNWEGEWPPTPRTAEQGGWGGTSTPGAGLTAAVTRSR
ncbi:MULTISPECIES: HNH endonuclease [Synechococcales]|uniref:HNH endonuclease n=1 Tax=Synechococcus sp. CS-1325 TaxID=2847979 RepID=UPI00223BE75E|nr:HNH endonuclease [Synechococcus sp. CS-1325]